MTFSVRLILTHFVAACAAGGAVWFLRTGQSSPSMLILICIASAGLPCLAVGWWLKSGLRCVLRNVTRTDDAPVTSGMPDFDELADHVVRSVQQQRGLAGEAEALLVELGAFSGGRKPSLNEALGGLCRSSARDVGEILNCGREIARGAHDANNGTEEQSRTVESAISSVAVLSDGIDSVGSHAGSVRDSARDVADVAERARGMIRALVRGMEEIRCNVEYSEKKVLALGQQSDQIGSIVETMGDLSARTNMLALNAAIEAVRAGRDGEGFSVVADEVRKLADHTAAASREISTLVNAIRAEAHDAVSAMAEERRRVEDEIKLVEEAEQTLVEISQSSSEAAEKTRVISETTVEQLRRTKEVVAAMQQVSRIAARIKERSDSIRSRTTDLVGTAQDLEDGLSPLYHLGELPSGHAGGRRRVTRRQGSAERDGTSRNSSADELVAAVSAGEFA